MNFCVRQDFEIVAFDLAFWAASTGTKDIQFGAVMMQFNIQRFWKLQLVTYLEHGYS